MAVSPLNQASGGTSPVASIEIRDLSKGFRRRDKSVVPAIDRVSLTVAPGEFVVLLGPSGCGKTTLLRCMAGLETPDSGAITIDGVDVFDSAARVDVAPNNRSLNMMFQSYALWPHMTVADNVGFPLRTRRVPRAEIRRRVDEVLAQVAVTELRGQYPSQLSGGQQQRVALARALVNGDQLILFDEPLSNVDAKVREQLRFELVEMQTRLGFAAVYVTHDQHEAMELADRVVVLDRGRVAQDAPPSEVYHRPASRYIANFIGSANEIVGVIASVSSDSIDVRTPWGAVSVPGTAHCGDVGEDVVLVWRPEAARTDHLDRAHLRLDGTVTATMFGGAYTTINLRSGEHDFRVQTNERVSVRAGEHLKVRVPVDELWALERGASRRDGIVEARAESVVAG